MTEGVTKIGNVKAIYLYPVKSMRGLAVDAATLWWYGFNGDRKCAFARSDNQSGFPWLTARHLPALLHYQPRFVDPTDLRRSAIMVTTPSGAELSLDDPALTQELAAAYGAPVQLMKISRGIFDAMPLSLFSTTTLQTIAEATGQPLEMRRFRPNIVVETDWPGAFPEQQWLNHTVTFGDGPEAAQLQLNYPIERCSLITIDPETTQRQPQVLQALATFPEQEMCAGIYGAVHRLGQVRVGDTIWLSH